MRAVAHAVGSMPGGVTPRSSSVTWVIAFVLTMFACQAAIAFGPFAAMRSGTGCWGGSYSNALTW